MITKENYITASFIDTERKNIEILLKDGDKVKSHIVESVSYTHLTLPTKA